MTTPKKVRGKEPIVMQRIPYDATHPEKPYFTIQDEYRNTYVFSPFKKDLKIPSTDSVTYQTRAQEALGKILPFSDVPTATIEVKRSPSIDLGTICTTIGCAIYVSTGFLDFIDDDNLLIAGIAHELGHYHGRNQKTADAYAAVFLCVAGSDPKHLVNLLDKLESTKTFYFKPSISDWEGDDRKRHLRAVAETLEESAKALYLPYFKSHVTRPNR